ncbi:hypothetical protein Scep_024800 [Stephania cephalantha]|uniref:Uncharacterized protein n=1 Tax=Stephania cephalantha TaxID=152367 RepID=A0AAP0HYS8_9MAGN
MVLSLSHSPLGITSSLRLPLARPLLVTSSTRLLLAPTIWSSSPASFLDRGPSSNKAKDPMLSDFL